MHDSTHESKDQERTREEINALPGLVLLEFGAQWCGFCQAMRPHVLAMLRQHPEVKHIVVEDGPGRPLGRSFRVKLWPTLVFLRDGQVIRQMARPTPQEAAEGLSELVGQSSTNS